MNLNDLTEVEVINERMTRLYGLHTVKNLPNYRVVFADEKYTEKRSGTFSVHAGDIFLREETGIREVEKYPWCRNQWVVEGIIPNPHNDVYEGDYIYNIVWAFPENLPLNWLAVMRVMHAVFNHVKTFRPKNQQEISDEENLKLAARKAEARNLLEDIPDKKHSFDKMVVLGHE